MTYKGVYCNLVFSAVPLLAVSELPLGAYCGG